MSRLACAPIALRCCAWPWPPVQLLDDLIGASLDFYGSRGELQSEPLVPVSLERAKDQRLLSTPLKFPGKIATDLANDRLFISDSNNHRIVSGPLALLHLAHPELRLALAAGSGAQSLKPKAALGVPHPPC